MGVDIDVDVNLNLDFFWVDVASSESWHAWLNNFPLEYQSQ